MSTNKSAALASVSKDGLLFTMNADQVSDAIKASGCAVTVVNTDGKVHLHSASQGIGFQVLWGNAVSEGEYVDLTLNCPIRIEGGILPDGLLADWHRTKRFVRAAQHGDLVVLEMDILAAGGITPNHLAMQMQLWSQMMGQFFQHLRNFTVPVKGQTPQELPQAMATV